MKHIAILFLFLVCCTSRTSTEVDFCQVATSIHQEKIKDSPDIEMPVIISEIIKIEDEAVKHFLFTKADRFNKFNFRNYFEEKTVDDVPNFKCNTIDPAVFNKDASTYKIAKKNNSKFTSVNYIKFFKPIFNNDKTEFILYWEEFRSDYSGTSRLILYDFKEGIVKYKKTLLVST
jgi:hypothetical protein